MKRITPQGYVCHRASGPIEIDGELGEAPWQEAAWTDHFVDIEGQSRPRPRFATRAKMLWDDRYLFIGADMEEPHAWATLTEHDSVIYHDNDFEVFIDPNGDNHEYYEFEINALGTGWDLMLDRPYKDGGTAENGWEIPGLMAAVRVEGTLNDASDTDRGWSVELAFPWDVLREHAHRPAPPRPGDQWRINFSRVQWRHDVVEGRYRKLAGKREDNWVWSPQGIIDMHRPERWGYVQFSGEKPGETRFTPDPAAPTRELLLEVYHHQKAYFDKHRRWAGTLAKLGLAGQSHLAPARQIELELTRDGFQATAPARLTGGRLERWRIRQDSRLWPE